MRRLLPALSIVAIALVAGLGVPAPGRAVDSTGLVPINDLGSGTYLGFQGGLYENGMNAPPMDHAAAGAAHAAAIHPLDVAGNPAAGGKIVLLSVGMSNTTQEFCSASSALPCDSYTFTGQSASDPLVNHTSLAIVNGAAGGQTASTWDSPSDANYDRVRDTRLTPAGLSEQQVQAVWLKVADAGPTVSLPSASSDAYTLETLSGSILRALKVRYPHVQMVFVSSRIYAGYATTTLNPEPYAYESGFAAKWLVQAQVAQMRNGGVVVDARAGDINYNTVAPWVGWGPYLWADGLTPRSDGLTWLVTDFVADGTHPSPPNGRQKVGTMLHDFFYSSDFTKCWYRADSDADGVADVCESTDSDGDGFPDGVEASCGSDPQNAGRRPERTDPPFAGLDDDGDTNVDEPLPPGAEASDCDGDGYTGTAEAHVFSTTAGDQDTCGLSAWPADLTGGAFSADRVNIQDVSSYIAPVRYLNTDTGTNPGDVRWDVVPGSSFGAKINIQDMTNLVTVAPPMLGGVRAFNGPQCPWP